MALPISKVERVLEMPGRAHRAQRQSEAFAMVDDELVLVVDLADRLALHAHDLETSQVHLVL